MSVIFESTIKMVVGSADSWYIELKDTADERVEICLNLKEYAQKVEELGTDYGGNIDEVKWMKDKDVPLQIMNNIRFEMSKIQREIEEETGKSITGKET